MAISPQLTIYLYSAHRAVIFATAQLSCSNNRRVLAWLSDSALVSITRSVTLRRARLVLGWWVTVCRRLNHLGM